MSSDKSNEPKSGTPKSGTDATQGKRPYATIDLRATELKPDVSSASGATATTGATAGAAGGTAAKPDAAKSGMTASTASAPPKQNDARNAAPVGTPPAPPPPRSGGFGRTLSYVLAGLAGGVIATLGSGVIKDTFGVDPRGTSAGPASTIAELNNRLSKIDGDLQRLRASSSDGGLTKKNAEDIAELRAKLEQPAKVDERVTQLMESQKKLEAQSAELELKLTAAAQADLAGRITALDESLKSLAETAQTPQGKAIPEVARLSARINEVSAAVAEIKKINPAAVSSQIEARLTEARKTEAQTAEAIEQLKADNARRVRELEALKTQNERLEQRVATNAGALEQSLATALKDVGAVRASIETLRADIGNQLKSVARQPEVVAAIAPVEQKIAGFESKLGAIVDRDRDRQVNAERIVLSLELANLRRAMDSGQPFAPALASVEKLAGKALDLTPLKAYQDKGIVSAATLGERFPEVARTILEAEREAGAGSTLDKLIASAKSVVQVRRTGADVEGQSTEAVLARIEHLLKSGNLEQAAAQAGGLAPAVRKPAEGWLSLLQARVAVDKALKGIEEALKVSLAGTPVGTKGSTQ